MKICKICNQAKSLVEFGIHKSQSDGHNGYCKSCLREKHTTPKARAESRRRSLKATYGITLEQYDSMLVHQNSVCAICRNKNSSGKPLSVDHCHTNQTIRGLLCEHCNHGIGKFFDNTEVLQKAVEYLKKYQAL